MDCMWLQGFKDTGRCRDEEYSCNRQLGRCSKRHVFKVAAEASRLRDS